MSSEIALRRIESFRGRFGERILILAYHAAFPIALTPDLLYRLWKNFQQDVHGNALSIPWTAVANLLLSTLVGEIGYELYEMDEEVRQELLKQLKNDTRRFGQQRLTQLSYFLQAYIKQNLKSNDPYERELAKVQQWVALAFVQPNKVARELASELAKVCNDKNQDKYELMRVAYLIETLAEPLKDYEPLLVYSREMMKWARENHIPEKPELKNFLERPKKVDSFSQNKESNLYIPQYRKPAPKELKFTNKILEDLYNYKDYAERILSVIEQFEKNHSLPEDSEFKPQLSKCLQDLKDYAKETIELATSPVKIAIMGEVSSGKTLLVGSLIGYADALPVSEIPITGNVIAVHLVQQEEEKTTQVEQFEVKYLSQGEVKKCLEHMLSEAEKRAQAAKVFSQQLEKLKVSPTNAVNWDGVLEWCEQAWKTKNLELRYLIRELVMFARSYKAYGKEICGKTLKIDWEKAKEGLKLNGLPKNILQMEFSQLPPEPQQWQNLDRPSASELQQSFSLIRRIDVTVKISKLVWDLSGLKGSNEFVLLDLPGLGSENSGVRDTWLSLLEIKEVQTFLLLLNGRASSPGQAASKIRTAIQQCKGEDIKDRIIVGVGRFNQLPLTLSDKKALDLLIDRERPFVLTSETVLFELGILKQIIISAENLTIKKDRIVLLSQTLGLAKLAKESSLMQVCSPDFQPELDAVNRSDAEESKLREKWKKLSEMLRESDSNSILVRQLSDFANDGGISRLRLLLEKHVAEHGLKLLCEDTSSYAQLLGKQQEKLKKILGKIREKPIVENPRIYAQLRGEIESLIKIHRELRENLRKQPLLKCNGVAVSDVVSEEVSFRISDWSEWAVLFNKIQDGIIKTTSASETAADSLLSKQPRGNNSIPTKSDDFYSSFKQTFEELRKFARDRTEEALKELLDKHDGEVKEKCNTLGEILRRPQMEQQIEENVGDDESELFQELQLACNPKEWSKKILVELTESNSTEKSSQTIDFQNLFPLANEDKDHNFGQIFDWSPQKRSSPSPKPFNHEFLLLRLRSEMVASAGLNLTDHVSQLTKKVNLILLDCLEVFIDEILLDLQQNEPLLRYIANGDPETSNRDWLEALSLIPDIN